MLLVWDSSSIVSIIRRNIISSSGVIMISTLLNSLSSLILMMLTLLMIMKLMIIITATIIRRLLSIHRHYRILWAWLKSNSLTNPLPLSVKWMSIFYLLFFFSVLVSKGPYMVLSSYSVHTYFIAALSFI